MQIKGLEVEFGVIRLKDTLGGADGGGADTLARSRNALSV